MKRFSFFFMAAALLVASCSAPASKDVEVIAPYVCSAVSVQNSGEAWLTVAVDLRNNTEAPVSGILRCKLAGGFFEMPVEFIPAGETVSLAIDSEQMPGLHFQKAKIWNTWDTGKPSLYDLKVEFRIAGKLSDAVSTTFGIREILTPLDIKLNKAIALNGARLGVRGVVLDEPDASVLGKLKSLGFNTVRIPSEAEVSEKFLDACDAKGFIVILGVGQKSAEDILALRHHPSIAAWLGSDKGLLPEEEEQAIVDLLKANDSRSYFGAATSEFSEVSGPTGLKSACFCCCESPAAWYEADAPGFYAYIGLPEEGEKEEAVRAMFESFRLQGPAAKGFILSAIPAGSQLKALKAACEPVQLIYNYADRQVWALSDKAGTVSYEIKFSDAEGRPVDSVQGSVEVEAGVPAVAAAVPSEEVAIVEVSLNGKSVKKYSL